MPPRLLRCASCAPFAPGGVPGVLAQPRPRRCPRQLPLGGEAGRLAAITIGASPLPTRADATTRLERAMLDAAQAAALLDKLAPTQSDLWTLGTKFREEADDPENPLVRAVSWALGYRLLESSEREAREDYGGPFAPMMEMRDPILIFPPYLLDLPNHDEVVAAWLDVADSVQSPAVAARLCDLAWCTHIGSERYRHARRAIESYLSAVDSADTESVLSHEVSGQSPRPRPSNQGNRSRRARSRSNHGGARE